MKFSLFLIIYVENTGTFLLVIAQNAAEYRYFLPDFLAKNSRILLSSSYIRNKQLLQRRKGKSISS